MVPAACLPASSSCLLSFKDGTLLTIFSSQGEAISRNILNKLKVHCTRTKPDGSLRCMIVAAARMLGLMAAHLH